MKERFSDIADLKFTANMEQRLDSVEEGKTAWKDVLREFYGDFEQDLENAEKALDGARIKVPDEVSEGDLPGVRAESGGKVRPVRPLPGLSRLPRVHVHHAAGGGDAGPLPQVRRAADEAHRQQQEDRQAVYLLLL